MGTFLKCDPYLSMLNKWKVTCWPPRGSCVNGFVTQSQRLICVRGGASPSIVPMFYLFIWFLYVFVSCPRRWDVRLDNVALRGGVGSGLLLASFWPFGSTVGTSGGDALMQHFWFLFTISCSPSEKTYSCIQMLYSHDSSREYQVVCTVEFVQR